jgi:hypothetical protein
MELVVPMFPHFPGDLPQFPDEFGCPGGACHLGLQREQVLILDGCDLSGDSTKEKVVNPNIALVLYGIKQLAVMVGRWK